MTTNNNDLLQAVDRALDERSLAWAARWIEDSLKGETNERVIEFGKNMAMTLRAAGLSDTRAAVAGPRGDTECRALGYVYEQPAALQWCVTHNRIMGECAIATTSFPTPAESVTSNFCGKCEHDLRLPRQLNGWCATVVRDAGGSLVYCGCKCAPAERAEVAGEWTWKCACGWSGKASQMTVSNDLRTCPQCGASGGLILDATLASDSARRAAEKLKQQEWLLADVTPEELEQVAAIIANCFVATPADNDAELRHCRTCSCEPCREHDFKEVGRCRYRCIRCHTEKFVSEEESGYPNFKDSEMPLG